MTSRLSYNFNMNRQAFLDQFTKAFLPDPQLPVVIAVSGGADSLCLLHLLLDSGFTLIPAHLDHQLREVSGKQANQLHILLEGWGLDLVSEKIDVRGSARENKLGIEEAARNCRYKFLFETAEAHRAQALLTAHHLDDQAETVLMHFLRGSGINGLSGMQPVEYLNQFSISIPVWRPMLGRSKAEIHHYCQENQIFPIEDESNLDTGYFRNQLRHEVIPYLDNVRPGFARTLARNAKAISLDRELLNGLAEAAFTNTLTEVINDQAVLFNRTKWQTLERGLQSRLIIKAARLLKPDLRDLGFDVLERVLNGIERDQVIQDLKAGILVQLSDSLVAITCEDFRIQQNEYPQLVDAQPREMSIGETLELANGWSLRSEIVDRQEFEALDENTKTSLMHAWLNPSDLEGALVVRAAYKGERWSPLGMVHKRQKMSDFFINQKVPQAARAAWAVVTNNGSVLWVAGLRIAQAWRLVGDEVELLHLELIPPETGLFNP